MCPFNLPLRELLQSYDRTILKGKFKGTKCYYKTGLLNVLIKLKPKICLEIGTWRGGTAKMFEYYFKKYRPDGVLITADVRKYVDISSDKIKQVLVYPHVPNLKDFHDVSNEHLLCDFERHLEKSVESNCEILKKELKNIRAESFDFCFVDGDHQEISFMRDLEIAKRLSKPPHYTLIDDTKEEAHECAMVYQNKLIHKVNHYDFDDWPIFVGMGLIWY